MAIIKAPMQLLIEEKSLTGTNRDHSLTNNWKGCRDLHIEPDWLLIYRIIENIVRFERTGSYSGLFRKSAVLTHDFLVYDKSSAYSFTERVFTLTPNIISPQLRSASQMRPRSWPYFLACSVRYRRISETDN